MNQTVTSHQQVQQSDSLRDTSAASHRPQAVPFGTQEFSFSLQEDTARNALSVFRKAQDPSQVYSEHSLLLTDKEPEPRIRPTDGSAWITGSISIVVLLVFFHVVFRYRSAVNLVLKSMFLGDIREKIVDDQDFNFTRLFLFSRLLNLLAIPLGIYKACQVFLPEIFRIFPDHRMLLGALLLAVAFAGVFQYMVIFLCTLVSGNREFFAMLRRYNRLDASYMALVLSPLVILYVADTGTSILPLSILTGFALGFLILKHFVQTWRFFKSEKVSILQWFLYLCSAELVPWSYFIVLAYREYALVG